MIHEYPGSEYANDIFEKTTNKVSLHLSVGIIVSSLKL